MKKTNIAKRIVSVVLAMSIVLSFALVSVSAIPADYTVVGDVVTQDFESSYSPLVKIGAESMALSEEKALSGKSSLKVVESSGGVAKLKINENIAGKGANNYYLSFWYYTETTDVNMKDLAGQEGETVTYKTYKRSDGWTKAIFQITTTSAFSTYLAFGDYGNAGAVIYIDDLEFAKVESLANKVNTVPAGATPVKQAVVDWDTVSPSLGVTLATTTGVKDRYVTAEQAHWGDRSLAYPGIGSDTTFYFHPRLLMSSVNFTTTDSNNQKTDNFYSGTYYFSYYVCSPDAQVTTSVVSTLGSLVAPATIPQGNGWTKVSGTFNVSEENNDKLNSALMNISVNGIGSNTVYFDDFLLAEIGDIQNLALTNEDVKYDFANKIATVTIASNIELKTAEVKLGEDVVTSTINADGKIVAEVPAETLEETYNITVSTRDAFDRVNDSAVSFTTPSAAVAPMTIAEGASSIKDGATDVVAPVDCIYIDVPYALNAATVIPENFTISNVATVTNVGVVAGTADKKIKVSLDGIAPNETYTLSVANVANTSGGVLTDSITFTTKASGGYSLDFEDIEDENGDLKVPGQLSSAGATLPININTDAANSYSGSNSIYLNGINVAAGYAMMWLNQTAAGKTYHVSFYIKSDDWKANNAGYTLFDSERGTMVGTPVVEETDKEGWRKVTAAYISNAGGIYLTLWGVPGTTVYLDNINVQEMGSTICNPIMTKAGAYVYDITAGDTTIEVPVIGGASSVKAFAVQYGENNKMITATIGTVNAAGNIEFALTNAQAVKTKIIIMDATTYAPLCSYIQYN